MAQSGAANLIIILRRYVLPFHYKTSKLRAKLLFKHSQVAFMPYGVVFER